MKIIPIILMNFVLIGCGSLKKDKTNTDIETKSNLNASKLDYKRFRDSSFIIRPFDASKPMLIGKDTVVNVIIENHYKDRVHVVKDTVVKKDTQVIEIKDKKVERDNTKLILGVSAIIALFFLIIIFVLIWWIGKKLPNGNE